MRRALPITIALAAAALTAAAPAPAAVVPASVTPRRLLLRAPRGGLPRAHATDRGREPDGDALHPARGDRGASPRGEQPRRPAALAPLQAGGAQVRLPPGLPQPSRERERTACAWTSAGTPRTGRSSSARGAAPRRAASSSCSRTSTIRLLGVAPTTSPGVLRYRVAVTNTGKAEAASVPVRLTVDGDVVDTVTHRLARPGRGALALDPRARLPPPREARGGSREGDRRELRRRQRLRAQLRAPQERAASRRYDGER